MVPPHTLNLDIETTHKLASFPEAKFSLKNTTEIPRPVHGPLQYSKAGGVCRTSNELHYTS